MSAEVETMAWAGEVPWHRQGVNVSNKLSAHEMLVAAKLDWKVEKRPMFIMHNDDVHQVKDKFALTRDSDGRVMSVVSDTYRPVQNEEAMSFFADFVKAGKMQMETAGSLYDGQYIWGLARIGDDFNVGRKKDDEVRGYVLLMQPHKVNYALIAQVTPIRVVCWNTLNLALGSGLKGKGERVFSMPHTRVFNDATKAAAERMLGIATEQVDEFKDAAQLLARKRASQPDVIAYFDNVLAFDRAKAEAELAKPEKKRDPKVKLEAPRLHDKLLEALEIGPGAELASAKGTWWGAFNAVTFIADHKSGRDDVTRLGSAWLGEKSSMKRRALEYALRAAA